MLVNSALSICCQIWIQHVAIFGNLLFPIFCSLWAIAKVGTPLKAKSGNEKNLTLPLLAIYEMQFQSYDKNKCKSY